MKKIRIDQEKVSEQEALEHKSFKKLENSYSVVTKPQFRYKNYLLGTATVIVLAGVFYLITNTKKTLNLYSNYRVHCRNK